jgi:hypothetical protein
VHSILNAWHEPVMEPVMWYGTNRDDSTYGELALEPEQLPVPVQQSRQLERRL